MRRAGSLREGGLGKRSRFHADVTEGSFQSAVQLVGSGKGDGEAASNERSWSDGRQRDCSAAGTGLDRSRLDQLVRRQGLARGGRVSHPIMPNWIAASWQFTGFEKTYTTVVEVTSGRPMKNVVAAVLNDAPLIAPIPTKVCPVYLL